MLSKIKYIIVAIFLFYSCNRQSYDFSSNETNISGTKIDIGVLLGLPSELIYLDTLLLFQDRYDNTLVTVFDTKNGHFVRRFITQGQGPGEVIPPLRLSVSTTDKQIYALQAQTGYLNIYEHDDIIDKDNIMPKQVFFEDRPTYIRKIKDGYIGIGLLEGGRFRLYDSSGNAVSSFGKYPFRGEEIAMNRMDRYVLYQGYIATSTDDNYFAIGTLYSDNLEFYRIKDGKAELIKKYETYDAKAVMNGGMIRIDNDCILNYVAAYGGKYCYMLYSGKTYLENNRNSSGGSKIIVFDWDGNYIKSYNTDAHIISFCVDEKNNIIYSSIRDDNDETGGGRSILKFDI